MSFPNGFKPMLAVAWEPDKVQFPVIASKKVDGFRCLIHNGTAYSRNLKPIPNRHVQEQIGKLKGLYDGHDGEIIVGNMNDPDVYRNTSSGVMSFDGEPNFLFWSFDRWDLPHLPYEERLKHVQSSCALDYVYCNSMEELLSLENKWVEEGYEGLMIRSIKGPYKYGRSTAKEGHLLKVKRFLDSEAKVIGFEERMHNANEATVDYLGHTKRSSHKENMHPMDTLGALICELSDGQTFKIGTGLDDAQRKEIWMNTHLYLNQFVKYKYVDVGRKNLPRFPVFLGFRPLEDM